MNERIRDLQIQAFAECKTFEGDKVRTDEVFERFAELIVRECLSYAKDGDIDFMKFMIKQNFGVE